MAFTAALVPYLLYAVAQLAVAALLLRVDRRRTVHRAFALLLAFRGAGGLFAVLGASADDPGAALYWSAVGAYVTLPVVFLVLGFVAVYPRRRPWLAWRPAPLVPYLLAAVAVDLAFAWDHALLWGPAGPFAPGERGPLWPFTGLYIVAFGAAAVVFGRDAARQAPGPARASLLLVAMGFAVVALYDGLLYAATTLFAGATEPFLVAFVAGLLDQRSGPPFVPWVAYYAAVEAAHLLGAALALGMVAHVARALHRSGDAAGLRRFLLLPALVVACVVLVAALPRGDLRSALEVAFLGVWRLAQPALVAVGILRHQLFDIDLRLKRGVQQGTVAGAFLLTFVVVSAGSRALVPGTLGDVLGALAAGLLILALVPLQRFGALVADAALPAVSGSSGYLQERRQEVYRAALEEAIAGDATSGSQSRVLAVLRGRLGISDREHALLEADVRAGRGASDGGPRVGARFLGKYRIEAALGEGGFGRAFLALDERVGRRVVLKAARAPSPEEAQRLLKEARTLAKLEHPHIVAVHDVEVVGSEVILVLAYLEGGSLADRLKQGPLPPAQAARLLDDVLAGLEAAHARGILHRDVKPANILLDREGRAKLADFGVAQDRGGSGTVGGLSLTGTNPGSVRYMSPEQVRGLPLDVRSDVYSAGVVLYEALAGRPYLDFEGLAEFDVRLAVLEAAPRLPLKGVPKGLNALLARALAKDPRDRPRSAAKFREALAAAAKTRR